MKRISVKTITRILAAHQREDERLKVRYERNRARLDLLGLLGASDLPFIELPDGNRLVVEDQYAKSSRIFKPVYVSRYVVKPFRAEKTALPKRPRSTVTAGNQPAPEVPAQP